jgi:N-dimethylarginine dimethylaminohydrolase
MFSKNEWDPLKSVIVGIADGAKIPNSNIGLRTVNYADLTFSEYLQIKHGNYPEQVISEANEDLEILCTFLSKNDVSVVRPTDNNPEYYNYCPRDNVLVHDDVILATPMAINNRGDEWRASKAYFDLNYLIVAPKPEHPNTYNSGCLNNPDILALNEHEPIFDAANILRCNDDLFYLVSNTGNKSGAEYLQGIVGPTKRVHTIENVYSYIHLDSTIALLREGLMLLNPARIKSVDQLPKPLRNWDIIWAPEPVDIGHYPGYCNSSKWVSVNLLSINPNLVVLEEHQHNLRELLEKHNIDCAMLPMRHARTLGGCFHCVTLDLRRSI